MDREDDRRMAGEQAVTEWRDIPGYEGRYQISDDGRIMTFPDAWGVYQDGNVKPHYRVQPFILSPSRTRQGYLQVRLSNDDHEAATWLVHRLVALAFIGAIPAGALVLHGNGDPSDNHVDNLRYGSPTDNADDRRRHGTHANQRKTHCNHNHEFTPENTAIYAGKRKCITCSRERARNRYRRIADHRSPA